MGRAMKFPPYDEQKVEAHREVMEQQEAEERRMSEVYIDAMTRREEARLSRIWTEAEVVERLAQAYSGKGMPRVQLFESELHRDEEWREAYMEWVKADLAYRVAREKLYLYRAQNGGGAVWRGDLDD